MLVSIALNAVTVCTARACTKCLDETQWPETQDKTYWAENETSCSEMRPSRWGFCPKQDRDKTLVRLETVSRLRCLNRDHIPALAFSLSMKKFREFYIPKSGKNKSIRESQEKLKYQDAKVNKNAEKYFKLSYADCIQQFNFFLLASLSDYLYLHF